MKSNRFVLILILGLLSAISPLSIDIYLPGFPAIAKNLDTTVERVSYSLSAYLVGISVGQLICGPLLDRFGRRLPLNAGLVIYIAGSVGCLLATNLPALVLFRLVQALGGCAAMVAPRAIVRDLFPIQENAKILSMLVLVLGVSPIIAPSIGSYVIGAFTWRHLFGVMAAVAVLVLVAVIFLLPESKDPDPSVSLKPQEMAKHYWQIAIQPVFLPYSLAATFASAGFFVYLSGSPFVLMKIYHLSQQQYGWLFGFIALGLIGSSQLNNVALERWSSRQILRTALLTQAGIGVILYSISALHLLNLYSLIALVFVFVGCLGFIFSNATALSMEPFSNEAGSASALIGALQMGAGAIGSAILGGIGDGTERPMMLLMGIFACLAALMLLINRDKQPITILNLPT